MPDPTRIDLFAHFTTEEFKEAYFAIPFGSKGRRPGPMSERTLELARFTTNIDVLSDFEKRIQVLDRHKIDMQVVTLGYPMIAGLEPDEEIKLARLANEGLAELIARYPGRFVGVGTLPFSAPEEAMREFDYCINDLGFKGFQIGSNVNGKLLDAPELFPFFQRAAETGQPVWLHPTTPLILEHTGTDGRGDLLFGWPMDTSIALYRLAMGGVMERLPNLKLVVHHLGAGMIPYLIERLDNIFYGGREELSISDPPSHYWKAMYHDTAAVDGNSFELGFKVFGPDHVVFGTDYPFGAKNGEQTLESRIDFLSKAQISGGDVRKIYEDNARAILGI